MMMMMMYDYVEDVQQVHLQMKIVHYRNTNDNDRDDWQSMRREYVERFHIVNNQELYRGLKMNVAVVVVVVVVERLNKREKNEEEV